MNAGILAAAPNNASTALASTGRSRREQQQHAQALLDAASDRIVSTIAFIDQVQVFVAEPPPRRALDTLRRFCRPDPREAHGMRVRRRQRSDRRTPADLAHYLQLLQPAPSAFDVLADVLGRQLEQGTAAIGYAEIACDWRTRTLADANALHVIEQLFRVDRDWLRLGEMRGEPWRDRGTTYNSPRFAPEGVGVYADRASKYGSEPLPACHVEWRIGGAGALKAHRIATPAALAALDIDAWVRDRLQFAVVDVAALGRQHRQAIIAERKRAEYPRDLTDDRRFDPVPASDDVAAGEALMAEAHRVSTIKGDGEAMRPHGSAEAVRRYILKTYNRRVRLISLDGSRFAPPDTYV